MRKKKNKKSINTVQLENMVYQEELENGLTRVDATRKKANRLSAQLTDELKYQAELKQKISYLVGQKEKFAREVSRKEYQLAQVHKQNVALKNHVHHLHQMQDSSNSKTTEASVIKNNLPKLIRAITKGEDFPKEKSILLSCVQEMIETTFDNEFSEVQWRARVSSQDQSIATRIRFSNMAMYQKDLQEIYLPIIKKMSQSFKSSGLTIKTKTRKLAGVVSEIEFTMAVPYRIKQRHLELP